MAKPLPTKNHDDALARTENLLRDAEEALQQERLSEFWKQWGSTLIGMALMLVIGTGAGVGWREWQRAQNEQATAALHKRVTAPEIVIGPEMETELGGNHAAIAYLMKAGALINQNEATPPKQELSKLYAAAARSGDNGQWGWLANWNALRIRMDDPDTDPDKLINDYESLALQRKGKALSALALTDAAIIAGERLKDPSRALAFVDRAEAVAPANTPMASILSDLRHLYTIRAQALKEEAAKGEQK